MSFIREEKKIERPTGLENETRDCVVRALSTSSHLPYSKVHVAFKIYGRKDGHGVVVQKIFHQVCGTLSLKATQVKRSGSVESFVKKHTQGSYFCLKRGHAFAVVDGVIHDLQGIKSHLKGAWRIEKIGGEQNGGN